MAILNQQSGNFSLKTGSGNLASTTSATSLTLDQDDPPIIEFTDQNGKVVGTLEINNGVMEFSGDVDKSAQKFFDSIVKEQVKKYIKEHYKDEDI